MGRRHRPPWPITDLTPLRVAEKSVAAAAMGGDGGEVEKKTAEKICRRCKALYEPSSNTPLSCRFHTSFFVCRRHDDQKRYYELRPDDPPYAAKFYDCCGAENPDAPGCTIDFHVSYDE